MRQKLWLKYFGVKAKMKSLMKEERGETNMIAIILIILAVIAVAAIFKTGLEGIVTDLIQKIRQGLGLS